MVWDKDSLIGKAKAMHTSKAKQGIHSLLPMGRQVFCCLQESRAPSRAMVTWEDKCHHLNVLPLPSSSPALYAEHDVIQCGMSLWSVGVSCPRGGPSSLLVPPPACSLVGRGEGQKKPQLCVNRTQQQLKHPCINHTDITPYRLLWRKLTLSRPKPAQPFYLNEQKKYSWYANKAR